MNLLKRLSFNLWYFRRPPWDTGVSPPELLEFIQNHPPGRALDIGCGTGTNVITLARRGWQVSGVDFAPRAIRLARRKARRAGIVADLRVADATRLDGLAGPFDLILDMGCFHGLSAPEKGAYLDNIEQLLAPQGTFLMYGFFRDPGSSGPGLVEDDVQALSTRLLLVRRQDGSERGLRPSAWFTFKPL